MPLMMAAVSTSASTPYASRLSLRPGIWAGSMASVAAAGRARRCAWIAWMRCIVM